jgi:predicted phosphate transport protein (TIGR00153 family)
MFFSKLMPHDGNFFELFNEHANNIVAASESFLKFVEHYGDEVLRAKYTQDVDKAEHACDDVVKEVHRRLHKTFITPIDRDQIFSLINTMDDVADLLQNGTEAMHLYNVKQMTPEMLQMAELCNQCCISMRNAVATLKDISDPEVAKAALKTCDEIDHLESGADRLLSTAITRLFREDIEVRELIKCQRIYELLEEVTDKCEDVANLVEGIVLENS